MKDDLKEPSDLIIIVGSIIISFAGFFILDKVFQVITKIIFLIGSYIGGKLI